MAPVFDETPSNQAIDELTQLTVTNAASDADVPANELSYALLSPPAGASIDTNGVITWIPAEDQGPGTNTITSVVTDDGVPPLSATNEFEVIVNEVNVAPVLDPIPDRTIHAEALFAITITATDEDVPPNSLSYGLVSGPSGSGVEAGSGLFTWSPEVGDVGTTNPVMVQVTDDGVPPLADTNGFTLIVTDPLAFTSVQSNPTGAVELTWVAISGTSYRVSHVGDLVTGAWSNLLPDVTAVGPSASKVDATAVSQEERIYNVRQVP